VNKPLFRGSSSDARTFSQRPARKNYFAFSVYVSKTTLKALLPAERINEEIALTEIVSEESSLILNPKNVKNIEEKVIRKLTICLFNSLDIGLLYQNPYPVSVDNYLLYVYTYDIVFI